MKPFFITTQFASRHLRHPYLKGGIMRPFSRKIPYLQLISVLLMAAGMMLCAAGCGAAGSPQTFCEASGFYFDTVISVRIYDRNSQEIAEQCMELAAHYEQLLSPYLEGSDIWKINHSGGAWTSVDQDTLSVLNAALSYARLSEGTVDPSIGSLSMLWNFGSGNQGILPSDSDIASSLSHVDYNCIHIRQDQVSLSDAEAQIDLGFIAKGFIGDKIKEFLLSNKVSSALIYLGGNVVTVGERPGHLLFRIGIQDPFSDQGVPLLTLEVSDKSVVSSGDYERFFEKDGKRYHHILSTSTGYPAESGLSQVTILSPSSTDGDALSTLCFILGYEKAAFLLESCPEIQAVFVTEDGDILYANF